MLGKFFDLLFGAFAKLFIKLFKHLLFRPTAVMMISLLGVVACSDGGRNPVDVSSGSPYGGSSRPTRVKIGDAYSIKGETYQPRFEPAYSESGMASWYGPGFHGRQTASGERYDQHQMTAAHRTLPLPSIVRVTRTDNGHSVLVRVNDRGPFHGNRIIDLSKAAANDLKMIGSGTAKVKVEYMHGETMDYIASLGIEAPSEMQLAKSFKPSDSINHLIKEETISRAPIKAAPVAPVRQIATADLQPIVQPKKPVLNLVWAQPVAKLQNDGAKIESLAPIRADDAELEELIAQKIAPAITASQDSGDGDAKFRVQTAAFSNKVNAQQHAKLLEKVANSRINQIDKDGTTIYRVSLEPVKNYETAMLMLKKTQAMGFHDARLMVE